VASTVTVTEVDLYAVLHVGERAYFQAIEERMQNYDVVLYELVMDEANMCYDN